MSAVSTDRTYRPYISVDSRTEFDDACVATSFPAQRKQPVFRSRRVAARCWEARLERASQRCTVPALPLRRYASREYVRVGLFRALCFSLSFLRRPAKQVNLNFAVASCGVYSTKRRDFALLLVASSNGHVSGPLCPPALFVQWQHARKQDSLQRDRPPSSAACPAFPGNVSR